MSVDVEPVAPLLDDGPGRRHHDPRRPRSRRLHDGATLAVGAGLLYVVGHDGATQWQIARAAVTVAMVVFALRVSRLGNRWQRGIVAFAIGALAIAIGIGIGLPHLSKTGATALAVAGLAVLGGGAVLAAVGIGDLVHPVRGWLRVIVATPLLLALPLVVLVVGQAVAATNVPPTSVGSRTPADIGLQYEDVEFETADDVTLSAWFDASRYGAAVVMLHGAGSTRSSLLEQAEVLAGHGYGLLLVDARGHGRSEGRAMDFGWYGDEDTAAAVTFLGTRSDVDAERIAVLGMSMGGEEAIGAAGTDDRVRAVVAEGATNRVAGDKAWLSDVHGWRGAVQEKLEWVIYTTADLLTEADQPDTLRSSAVAASPRPILLIAGGAEADEIDAGRHIRAGSPGTVELWVVPGSGHTDGIRTDPAGWEARVVDFLDRALS